MYKFLSAVLRVSNEIMKFFSERILLNYEAKYWRFNETYSRFSKLYL